MDRKQWWPHLQSSSWILFLKAVRPNQQIQKSIFQKFVIKRLKPLPPLYWSLLQNFKYYLELSWCFSFAVILPTYFFCMLAHTESHRTLKENTLIYKSILNSFFLSTYGILYQNISSATLVLAALQTHTQKHLSIVFLNLKGIKKDGWTYYCFVCNIDKLLKFWIFWI